MDRRRFLKSVAAATALPTVLPSLSSAQTPNAMVLYDDRAIALDRVRRDAKDPNALWVRKRDLPRINQFELKPQGACRDDICIPVPKSMSNGDYFNLTAFAGKAGQAVVAETNARVWSFGEIPVVRGAMLESRQAPDFVVPDRKGRQFRLSDFRGKKVLVVTWASW